MLIRILMILMVINFELQSNIRTKVLKDKNLVVMS